MNTKLHAVSDADGRPLSFFMTARQVSDYTGAAALLDDLPKAQWLLGDRGYDADWFRDALEAKGIQPAGKKGDLGRLIGRTKGGMNTKLHAVSDADGRPLSFFMTAGQVSDYTGAAALLDDLPKAQWLLGDRGYDADWFRDALEAKGIQPCIPGRRSRNEPVRYDKRRYRRRSRIEIMFGRLKDWRRVATRYDRCPTVFFSAVALAATVIFWL